jgi:hypothetical protein
MYYANMRLNCKNNISIRYTLIKPTVNRSILYVSKIKRKRSKINKLILINLT